MTVRSHRAGPVTTVTIDRPDARNAVDGPTAAALAGAFAAFDADPAARAVRLPQIVGLGRALDLILTGRPVPAAEALAMGLVSRVVPPGGAVAAGLARFRGGAGRGGAPG